MRYDIKGYNIDNLIKTLYLKKITIHNLVREGNNHLSFEVLDKDKRKVNRLIKNFEVKCKPSVIKQLPKLVLANIGMVIGIIFGVIIGSVLSNFTFQIEVFGMEELKKKDILRVLEENNVSINKINTKSSEEIEDILLNHYDRIAQVSVIKKGTAIIINLSEKLVYKEEVYLPIVAKYNGIIRDIHVVTGTINVKVGEYVNAGDILILPFNINANGDKVSVKPIGEIVAEITIIGQSRVGKQETRLVRTGKTNKEYEYKIFNFKFNGKTKNSFALFEIVSYNENVSRILPFTRRVSVYYELEEEIIDIDFTREEDRLLEESRDKVYSDLPNGEIINESSEVKQIGDNMIATTNITILGNINDIN